MSDSSISDDGGGSPTSPNPYAFAGGIDFEDEDELIEESDVALDPSAKRQRTDLQTSAPAVPSVPAQQQVQSQAPTQQPPPQHMQQAQQAQQAQQTKHVQFDTSGTTALQVQQQSQPPQQLQVCSVPVHGPFCLSAIPLDPRPP